MKFRRSARASLRQVFGILALILVAILTLFLWQWTGWHPYWLWSIACSVVTLALYRFDKAQSRAGGLRVPEVVLHGLALAGGWAGGWLGRTLFRHKTRKPIFTWWLAVSTVLHLGVMAWLYMR